MKIRGVQAYMYLLAGLRLNCCKGGNKVKNCITNRRIVELYLSIKA